MTQAQITCLYEWCTTRQYAMFHWPSPPDPASIYSKLFTSHPASLSSLAVTELSRELDPTMTDQANIPIINNHYAPHAREEMAEAMKEDYPVWKQNTDIDKFREKFGFSSANARDQKGIDDLVSLSTGVGTPEGCQRLLSAVGNLVKGAANDSGEPMPKLIKAEKGPRKV